MKDPAFLFYSSDFLTGCMDLTMEERGKYITLMCLQHQKGHLSEKTICLCLGLGSVNDIPDVIAKFKVDEDGLYYNERLAVEIEKREKYTSSRRDNGKNGGRPKIKKENHMVNHMPNHSENEDENNNKGGMGENSSIPFDDFWNLYDKKRGDKGKLSRRWDKMSAKDKEAIMAYIPAYKDATPDKQYRKDPQTFFNNRSWEDELITSKKETITQEQKREDHVHE